MTLTFATIPQKRLLAGITSAATEFYLTNILSFDGENDVLPSDLGTQHFVCFRNDTGSIIELMEIDPSTISAGPITIVRRGLSFYGDLTTEDPDKKLDWPSNSIVMFGTDVPQIFQWLKEYIDAAAIAGAVPASTTAAGIVVEASQAEVNAGTPTKTISSVVYKLFAPLDKLLALLASTTQQGLVEEATAAEVLAGTTTGGTGARLFINPNTLPIQPFLPFGNGADGAVLLDGANTYTFFTKVSSTYTLTRDIFCTTFSISSGVTVIENGYAIYASVSIINAGTIHNNGGAGANGSQTGPGTGTGGIGGTAAPGGTFTAGTAGGDGGGLLSDGTNGIAKTCLGSAGSAGGGGSGGRAGGTGGTATAETVLMRPITVSVNLTAGSEDSVTELYRLIASTNGKSLSSSAGSGGGAGSNSTGGGGGAGGSGGVVFLASPIINSGIVTSNGGAGGNGSAGGFGGGGGGGAGGTIFMIYKTLTAGTITAGGGAAGLKGDGNTGNSDGTIGNAGKIYKVKVTNTIIV